MERRLTGAAPAPLPAALRGALGPRALLVGVGRRDRGDDGFGPRLARRLARAGLPALDAGDRPEACASRIAAAQPRLVLLADAADFGGQPGEVRLLEPAALQTTRLGTHGMSLALFARYLAERAETRVLVVACQGKSLAGARLSAPVSRTLAALAAWLAPELGRAPP